MKTVATLVVLAALAGCTIVPDAPAVPQPATLMDGRPGLKAECHGGGGDWEHCFAAARAACPGGFVVDRRDNENTAVLPLGKHPGGMAIRRTLVFACK